MSSNNLFPKHGLKGNRYLTVYQTLFEKQQGKCAVCERQIGDYWRWSSKITNFMIDHSHTTGEVRGLLCGGCNTQVGNYENGKRTVVEKMAWPVNDYVAKIEAYLEAK